jgi:hypothetical protein
MPQEPASLDYDEVARRGGDAAMRQLGRFFMKEDEVYEALRAISGKLEELSIPYAIAGGMALNAHGFRRGTVDVDILVSPDGLRRVHEKLEGLGYVPPFAGSKNLKDVQHGVRIEFLVSGQFPGDGKPKPVAFPEPEGASVEIDGIRYLGLPHLVELKLASGMTGGVTRLKDFADVVALIQALNLPRDFGAKLNPYVRAKYEELWQGIEETKEREV